MKEHTYKAPWNGITIDKIKNFSKLDNRMNTMPETKDRSEPRQLPENLHSCIWKSTAHNLYNALKQSDITFTVKKMTKGFQNINRNYGRGILANNLDRNGLIIKS